VADVALLRHLVHQGPVLRALGAAGLSALTRRGAPRAGVASVPGPTVRATVPARPDALVRDYVAHVGGDAEAWRGQVPPHMFPQWGFPLAARTLDGLPYPLVKVMNAGCRLEARAPLPTGQRLHVSARLESVDDDGRRALLRQRIVTGTDAAPEAVVAELFAFVPLRRGDRGKAKAEPRLVPEGAREVQRFELDARAGLEFAALTGDVNPIHWLAPYARAFGFRRPILHGFATFARAFEGLARGVLGGDRGALAWLDARFVRPLVLPARVGLYVDDADRVWVGDRNGGDAYLEGSYGRRGDAAAMTG
jgi:acyl dehydratase